MKYSFILVLISMTMASNNNNFSILQWNARGITHKIEDVLDTCKFKPDILLFQETNLIKNLNFEIEGYTIFRFGEKKTGRGTGKGIMTAVKKTHIGWVLHKSDNDHAQTMTTEIYINKKNKVHITNIYRKTKNTVLKRVYSLSIC